MSHIWHNDPPPWEEESWTAFDADDDGDQFGIMRGDLHPAPHDFVVENGMCPDDAILAAAAPEMARLLIALEWSGEYFRCPACDRPKPGTNQGSDKGHTDECELVSVLRKAGVLRP